MENSVKNFNLVQVTEDEFLDDVAYELGALVYGDKHRVKKDANNLYYLTTKDGSIELCQIALLVEMNKLINYLSDNILMFTYRLENNLVNEVDDRHDIECSSWERNFVEINNKLAETYFGSIKGLPLEYFEIGYFAKDDDYDTINWDSIYDGWNDIINEAQSYLNKIEFKLDITTYIFYERNRPMVKIFF